MENNIQTNENRCEISYKNGKYLCKVFFGRKLWNVFETNFKGLKKIVSSFQKRDFRKFNML